MNTNIFRLSRCAAIVLLFGNIGWSAEPFPSIQGENLLGKKVTVPEAWNGHSTVVVIGFTHASQTQTKAWAARLRSEFNTYSIAVLEDAPRLVRGMAVRGIKGDVPQSDRDRFLVIFQGEKELKQAVGFERPDDAYLVLVDSSGLIRWRFHGPLSESAFDELKTQSVDAPH